MVAVIGDAPVRVPKATRVSLMSCSCALAKMLPPMSLSKVVPSRAALSTALLCRSVISSAAYSKLVLVFVKLSRKPWLSLSCPATG